MNIYKGLRVFLGLIVGLLFQVGFASTTIVGNVSVQGPDAPVGPINGAFVMVSRPNFPNQILASAKTDASGNYSITGLAAGSYQMRFSKTGFDDGIMQSHGFKDQATEEVDAQLVPLLTGTEVEEADEKQETQFTINNPNSFSVTYQWHLSQKHLHGTAVAPPGNSIIDTVIPPHVEEIQLSVDKVEVQPAQPSDVAPPVIVGDLTGFVDDNTGAPLAGVSVTLADLQGGGFANAFTLADGSYVFHNEPQGHYKLTYTLAGFVVATQVINLHTGGGQAPTEILTQVPPPPTATVAVTVVDSNHAPTPNVTVTISYSNGANYQGTTDGNGHAQFTGQPVGVSASITAISNDGSGRNASTTTSGFTAGTNSVNLTLPPIPTGSISGTVTDANNNPLANVDVVVLNASNTVVTSTTTGAGGTYTISGLVAGTYSMTFSLSNYVTGSKGGVAVTSGRTTAESIALVTVASTQATVAVTITDGGNPAAGASVSIAYSNGTNSTTLTTNGNGLATFTGQPAGVVGTVTAIAGDGTGRSISSSPAAFTAGTTTTVSLALPPVNNAVISGTVKDAELGSGISGVLVSVADSHGNVVASTTTATGGTYSVGGLGLQTYTVTFSASGYQALVATAAGNTQLSVSLIAMNASVSVQITDTYGNAISGATVVITYVGNSLVATGTTDGNGNVSFSSQLSGVPAVVSAVTTDGRTASQAKTFGIGNNFVGLTVTSDFGVVSGTVVDSSTSLPLSGATVSVVDYNNNPVTTTTTNGAGNYVVQNLNPGTYSFTFSQAGYQVLTMTVPVTVNTTSTENAGLTPAPGSIQGSVTGSISQARVPGAHITLNGPGSFNVTADSNGNFSIAAAPAGNYTGTLSSGIFSQSVTTAVSPNQTTTLNLILDTTSIAGKITDQNGNPLAGATVSATTSGFTSATVVTDQSGNYVMNRESNTGTFTVTVNFSVPGGGSYNLTEQIVVQSSPPEDVIPTIVLNIPSSLAVQVTDGSGNPVTGASVTINYQNGASAGPQTTTSGSTTFNSLIFGTPATVTAQYVDGTGTVFAATSASMTFLPGANSVSLQLSPAGFGQAGNVNVQVTDQNGNPLMGASVTIVYTGGDTSATQTTDGTGFTSFLSQQTGVAATINVSYTDSSGNTYTSSRSVPGGFLHGVNSLGVAVQL